MFGLSAGLIDVVHNGLKYGYMAAFMAALIAVHAAAFMATSIISFCNWIWRVVSRRDLGTSYMQSKHKYETDRYACK